MVILCSVPNCGKKQNGKGLCNKHYLRKWYGKDPEGRSRSDPNKFVIEGDVCTIAICNRKAEIIAETIIDAEDYEKCKPYKWYGMKDRKNLRARNNQVGLLSNFLLDFKYNILMVVDHKNDNTLDNRKENLQIITNQQNIVKGLSKRKKSSGYIGVSQIRENEWTAKLWYKKDNRRRAYNLGRFSTKEEAALAYNRKALEVHGSFASLNIIEGAF